MKEEKNISKLIFFLVFDISAGAANLALSEAYLAGLFAHVALVVLWGWLYWVLDISERYIKSHCLWKIVGAFIAITFGWNMRVRFYYSWRESSKMNRVLLRISDNPDTLLQNVSKLLTVSSIVFFAVTATLAAEFIWETLKLIRWPILWDYVVKLFNRKTFTVGAGTIVVAACLGIGLIILSYQFPSEVIQINTRKSAEYLKGMIEYPIVYERLCSGKLDNFTDSIMLRVSSDETEDGALNRAMYAYQGEINGKKPLDALVSHYVENRPYDSVTTYSRYWHGYQIVLRPLLVVMDYQGIQIINLVLELMLAVLNFWMISKRKNVQYAMAYFVGGYLMQMPLILAKSMQYADCYYLYSIGTLLLLCMNHKQRKKYTNFVFLSLGIAVAYFDFLTYPIAVFGIPVLICVMLDDGNSMEKVGRMIQQGICWGSGYAGMWSLKWIVATGVTGTDVIANAAENVLNRTSHITEGTKISIAMCIVGNVEAFLDTPATLVFVGLLAWIFWKALHSKRLPRNRILQIFTPYATCGCLPLLWYMLLVNHSSIHYWFTNRACVVLITAILFAGMALIEEQRISSVL